jgi:short-subunit dehydrogenase
MAITSVVNNAGFGTWGRFHDEDPNRLRQMIAVDVTALTDISRAFLPELRADGTGYLMNIASVGAYAPVPNQAAYSAAKAYVLSLTEALWAESRGTGLRVMAFSPGVTQTEYFDVVGSTDATGGSSYQSAEQAVSNALRALQRRNPPPSAVSGWKNHALAASSRLLSRRRVVSLTARNTLRDSRNS